jgi:hypothetical protein
VTATRTTLTTAPAGRGTERIPVRCPARRDPRRQTGTGAVDRIRLGRGACLDLEDRDGTETAWYVLRGPVALTGGTAEDGRPERHERMLTRGDLVLAPPGAHLRLHGGPLGAELLRLTAPPDHES